MAGQRSFLDTGWARAAAALILLMVLAALAVLHRDDLFPRGQQVETTGNPALSACIADRTGQIDRMLVDGVIRADQADSFRARAVRLCQQTVPAR